MIIKRAINILFASLITVKQYVNKFLAPSKRNIQFLDQSINYIVKFISRRKKKSFKSLDYLNALNYN